MKRPSGTDTPGLLPNRACRNCIQIKVKCTPLENSAENICQRCHRLKKTCTTPAPIPRSQRARSTRVAHLEQRMDQLSALLSSAQQTSEVATLVVSEPSNLSSDRSTHNADATSDHLVEEPKCPVTIQTGRNVCQWASSVQPLARSGSPTIFNPSIPDRKDGSQLLTEHFCPMYLGEELETRLFSRFRTHMQKEFPFVVISPSLSNEQFKEKRPFVYWSCIWAASHPDRKMHQTLHDEMMKAVGYRLLVACGKNLDLLQGLLILTAWHHYISHYSPQMMNLLHLTQALLADLGILKSIRKQDKIRIASDGSAMIHGNVKILELFLSLDERRALLGCFWLSSKLSLTFNRIDPLRYSAHIGECCEALQTAAQYPSDRLCVELVQLHRIFGKYLQLEAGSTAASNAYRTMFQDEIRQYKQNHPPDLMENDLIAIEMLSGSLNLLEPSYTSEGCDRMDYLGILHACHDVGSRLVDVVIGMPEDVCSNFTLTFSLSALQLFIVYSRLSFFKSDLWDSNYARRTLDFGAILDRLERKFWNIHQYEVDTYSHNKAWKYAVYAKKVRHIRAWLDVKITTEEATPSSPTNDIMPNAFSETFFGTFDDPMWQDVIGEWSNF